MQDCPRPRGIGGKGWVILLVSSLLTVGRWRHLGAFCPSLRRHALLSFPRDSSLFLKTPSVKEQQQQRQQEQEQETTTDMIRLGLRASQNVGANITAAEHACTIWENVFATMEQHRTTTFPSNKVLKLSKTLYASCLVRVGRDRKAISVYEDCLKELVANPLDSDQEQSLLWTLAKAQCHQRLLEYSAALCAYQRTLDMVQFSAINQERALMGAVTCALRLGNVSLAHQILSNYFHFLESPATNVAKNSTTSGAFQQSFSPAALVAAVVGYLRDGNGDRTIGLLTASLPCANPYVVESGVIALHSPSCSSFLCRWILCRLLEINPRQGPRELVDRLKNGDANSPESSLLELIQINISPLDDPHLVYLDDKIELHKMLTIAKDADNHDLFSFWPEGLILPNQLSTLKRTMREANSADNSSLWISKTRAGYGSHGNQIQTIVDAGRDWISSTASNDHGREEETVLLQHLVHPLVLLQGYTFSLRIYIVYFSSSELYISSQGLVKVASEPFDTSLPLDSRMHMTNSGREASMQQHDLEYLWKQLPAGRADNLWEDICKSSADVFMNYYPRYVSKNGVAAVEKAELIRNQIQWQQRREKLGIPKILGLDFVVEDASERMNLKPWLVEVNRFPGLEPRSAVDRKIKYHVVRDAWKKAAERLNSPKCDILVDNFVHSIFASDNSTSLRRL